MQQANATDVKKGDPSIRHRHGNKGRKWTKGGLQRHMQRQHGVTFGYGVTLAEMKAKHNELHGPVEHTHHVVTGVPWTVEGLVSHLARRHGITSNSDISTDLSVGALEALRVVHDEAHGGTQIEKEPEVVAETFGEQFERKLQYIDRPVIAIAVILTFAAGGVFGALVWSIIRATWGAGR